MKKYIVANWKANRPKNSVDEWLNVFLKKINQQTDESSIVLCPSFPFIPLVAEKVKSLKNVFVGSQDISSFGEGNYTGEVPSALLSGLVDYSIIGHSERRTHLNESDEILTKKVSKAREIGIEPIFCIRGNQDPIPEGVKIIAYEPVLAIGTGNNESLPDVLQVKQSLKLPPDAIFLYGGSVDQDNARSYLSSDQINGLLVGTASLDPERFYAITCSL